MMDKTKALAHTIRQAISSGAYPPGAPIPSEREFGDLHGLSRTTIRRAIQTLVDEGHVVRRAGSGTFVAEAGGQQGASRDFVPAMSLIIPTFSNPFYAEMIDGIEQKARQFGFKLMTNQSGYSVDSESSQLTAMAADPSVRGAIVVPSVVDEPSPGALQFVRSGKPLVYMGRWPGGIAADGASLNYMLAARSAVDHLIKMGHTQIAYVEGVPHLPGFSLMDGYQAALKAARLPQRRELVRVLDEASEMAGETAVKGMLAEGIEFTAVFARNDVTAVGVARALTAAGLRIPDDVALASVNNSLLARSMTPPLTSVNVFPEILGGLAFRLLYERLEGSYDGPPMHISLNSELIVRASSDRLRVNTR